MAWFLLETVRATASMLAIPCLLLRAGAGGMCCCHLAVTLSVTVATTIPNSIFAVCIWRVGYRRDKIHKKDFIPCCTTGERCLSLNLLLLDRWEPSAGASHCLLGGLSESLLVL